MIVGPRIITDKSFVQSLNGDLIEEMAFYFTMTSLPTLVSEIIGDLKRPPKADGRIGEDLVRQLAQKMTAAHGAEPPRLRSLVFGSLLGQQPPTDGLTLPVSEETQGVVGNASGSQLLVSQIPQQQMWRRWADGDFGTEDEEAATAWRAGIEATDLNAEAERWKSFAAKLGMPNSLETVVEAVDRVMADRSRTVQTDLIGVALTAVRGEMNHKNTAINRFIDLPKGTTLVEYAPYAATVARLYLCFAVGLARGFIGPRPSNVIDLQYLLYAPFCRVFVSLDKLHRTLWKAGAVSSLGDFVWGDDFRADLKTSNEKRKAMTPEAWAMQRRTLGHWPEDVQGSLISLLWNRHCPWYPRGGDESPNVGKHIDDIDDPPLKAAIAAMEKLSKQL